MRTEPTETRLGIVRGISYGLFGPPDEFMPQLRELGARLVRVYVYWDQVEPRPGEFEWGVVDAFLDQLDGTEEVWVTVCSSSGWATRTPTNFLPPSPAKDLDTYAGFVCALVGHCAGRVQYWQCDNEPSNTGLLWAGTAEEYLAQLRTFAGAVHAVDPDAAVVLGGCGYDVLSSAEGSEQRRFFGQLVREGRDDYDLFDVHLYGQPDRAADHVAQVRAMMRAHGYEKPVVAGELNGPAPYEFPAAEAAVYQAMAAAFTDPAATQLSTDALQERAAQETPERRAMRALYERAEELPPELRMFLVGCPPELEAKRYRMACRGLVVRVVLALAEGVHRAVCWNLAPEIPGYDDPHQIMRLMFGTFPLLGYDGSELGLRHPTADTFQLLARELDGARGAHRVDAGDPDVFAFAVDGATGPRYVVWHRRDQFTGEDEPPVAADLPWPHENAQAVDVFGAAVDAKADAGRLYLELRADPLFIAPSSRAM
ncbi:MAG TPA: hypothetical protein VF053_07475 [Streptosporangiales bacterium]